MDENVDWCFLVYLIISAVLVVLWLVIWYFMIPRITYLLFPIIIDQSLNF